MAKRKKRYSRHLAAVLAASMIVPQTTPILSTFAADDIKKESPEIEKTSPTDADHDVKEDIANDTEIKNINIENDIKKAPIKTQKTAAEHLDVEVTVTEDAVKEWDGTDKFTGRFKIGLSGNISDSSKIGIDTDLLDVHFEDSEPGNNKHLIVENIQAALTGEDADKYTVDDSVTIETESGIKKRTMTIGLSVQDKTYVENDTRAFLKTSVGNIAPVDVKDGQLITGNLDVNVSASYEDANVGNDKKVIINSVDITGSHAKYYDYELTNDVLTGNILKADRNSPSLNYNKETKTIEGIDDTMEWRLNGGEWKKCTGNINVSEFGFGTYEIRYSETDNYNASRIYKLTYGTEADDPSDFYVRFADDFTGEKEYDGTNKAYGKYTYGGIVGKDDVKLSPENIEAVYDSSSVGENKTIRIVRITLEGKDAEKYQPYIDQKIEEGITFEGTIKPRTIDVDIMAEDKVYDGSTDAKIYVVRSTNFVEGDDVDFNVPSGYFQDADAGENKSVTLSDNISITGNDNGNYVLGTVGYGEIVDGMFVKHDSLTADIKKASQKAPAKELFSIDDDNVIHGYTNDMEVLLPGESEYRDCASLSGPITAEDGMKYVFRYKEDKNHLPGSTTTLSFNVEKVITVTFDVGDEPIEGSYPEHATVKSGDAFGDIIQDITPADPDREFVGWYTDPVAGERVYPDTICDSTKDITLYARFADKIFNRKDGSITVSMTGNMYGNKSNNPVVNNVEGDYTDYVFYYKKTTDGDGSYTTEKPILPGSYTVKAVALKTDNYEQAEATAQYTISKRMLTVISTPINRVYNGSTEVGLSVKVEGGIMSWDSVSDDVKVNTDSVKANTDDKNIGNHKKVNVGGIKLEGEDADRYDLTYADAYVNITPYELNYSEDPIEEGDENAFSIHVNDKIYNGDTDAAFAVSATKFGSDDVQFNITGTYDDANVDPSGNTVTITDIKLTGKDAANYVLNAQYPIKLTGTVKKAANKNVPDIKGVNPSHGLQNGRITGLDDTMEYSTDGGKSWNPCATDSLTGLAAGEYRVRYKETNNYTASGASIVTLLDSSVTEMVRITFVSDGDEVSFSEISKGSSPANAPSITKDGYDLVGWFTESGEEFIFGETPVNEDIKLYARWEPEKVEMKDGRITVSMNDSTYGDPLSTPNVTVIEGNYSYNDYTFTYTDTKTDEVLDKAPVDAGTYKLTVYAKENTLYRAAKAETEFDILPRELKFSVKANDKVYDGTTDVVNGSSYSFTDVIPEDDGKIAIDNSNISLRYNNKNVGVDKPLVVSGYKITGERAFCYKLPDHIEGKGTITKKDIDISVSGVDKDYDGTDDAIVIISSDDICDKDKVSFAYEAHFEGKEPGVNKKVNVTNISLSGEDAGNYNLITKEAKTTADIRSIGTEKRDGKIEVKMKDFVYGDSHDAPEVRNVIGDYDNYEFLYRGENSKEYTDEMPVFPGNYFVKAIAKENEHFNETSAETAFTIDKREISFDFTVDEKTYDGTTLVYGYDITYGNIMEGDKSGLVVDTSGISMYFSDKNAGDNKTVNASGIKLTGARAGLYKLPEKITGTGSIKQKAIDIEITGRDKVYDKSDKAYVDITSNDIIENDDITFTYNAKFDDPSEGTDKKITVTDIAISGKDAGNYTLNEKSGIAYADITDNPAMLYDYSIKYVSSSGKILYTEKGSAADGSVVYAVHAVTGYDIPSDNSFVIDKDASNSFTITCNPTEYSVDVYRSVDGKKDLLRSVTYTIENAAVISGTPDAHEKLIGYEVSWDPGMKEVSDLYAEYEIKTPDKMTGNLSVTLYFEEEETALRFDANGGSGEMDTLYPDDISKLEKLPANTFERKGYTFIGWASEADGNVMFKDEADLKNIDLTNISVLYAVWQANTNKIGFDLNGGTSLTEVPEFIEVKTGEPYPSLPIVVSTDSSNPFIGWFTADGKQVQEGDICEGETTLYAHYGKRSEGRITLTVRPYQYGNTPDITVNIVKGDYKKEDLKYTYRSINGTEWFTGFPEEPGEYVLRVTADATNTTLGTSVQYPVTVERRQLSVSINSTDKVYDGTDTSVINAVLSNVINGDDVKAETTSKYDGHMPGDHKITVTEIKLTGADAYKYDLKTKTVTVDGHIDKMKGEAVSVNKVNETIYGKDDGKITGVTSEMEYRPESDDSWYACTDGELTGLQSGTYEIRMKETDISYAGPIVKVTINSDRILTMTTVNADGTTSVIGIPYGDKLDEPDDPVRSGYYFRGWYKDEKLTEKWDFENDIVTGDVKLYPKWVRRSSGGGSSGGGGGSSSGGSPIIHDGVTYNNPSNVPVVHGEWNQDIFGNWRFTANGRLYQNEWAYVANPYADISKGQSAADWFHFGADGIMDTGWFTDTDGRIYYLNPVSDNTRGRMLTGWQWIKGNDGLSRCYYFETVSNGHRGALYVNTITPDNYAVDKTGAWLENGSVVTK